LGGWLGDGWSGLNWLRIGMVAGCYEYGDEPSGSSAIELAHLASSELATEIWCSGRTAV
jgi:hypothetical protein